jgi:DNA-binding NtrC family response regulator
MKQEAPGLAGLVGCCPAMQSLKREIEKLAPSDLRVHVFGETGTGKERVARALHDLSPRARRPFVAFNAAGFTDELLLAELFGHMRGAFTGAVGSREGYVARAEGGTLFIDEVAELSPVAQGRLLRFLEEKEYQPIGETAPRRADVRVVSATNVDLARRVGEGRFRLDLWFRLKDEVLHVPALRERGGDVLLLARHLLRAQAPPGRVPTLPHDVERALRLHTWPGNVRELKSEMRRLAVRAAGRAVSLADLSRDVRQRAVRVTPAGGLKGALRRQEARLLNEALDRNGGVLTRAAAELGITRQSLWAKLRRLTPSSPAAERCYPRRPSAGGSEWRSGTSERRAESGPASGR